MNGDSQSTPQPQPVTGRFSFDWGQFARTFGATMDTTAPVPSISTEPPPGPGSFGAAAATSSHLQSSIASFSFASPNIPPPTTPTPAPAPSTTFTLTTPFAFTLAASHVNSTTPTDMNGPNSNQSSSCLVTATSSPFVFPAFIPPPRSLDPPPVATSAAASSSRTSGRRHRFIGGKGRVTTGQSQNMTATNQLDPASSEPALVFPPTSYSLVIPDGGLYKDILQHLFAFLDFRQFARTCVITKEWYAIGRTMKPRREEWELHSQNLDLVLLSPLRIHISRLTVYFNPLQRKRLLVLRARMSHLDSLDMFVKFHPPFFSLSHLVHIPTCLQELSLTIMCDVLQRYDSDAALVEYMKQIATSSTRLLKLNIQFMSPTVNHWMVMDCPPEFLQSLQTLSTLTDLTLPIQLRFDQQIDLVKSMPHLRRWGSSFWDSTSGKLTPLLVERLVAGDSPPQLEDIGPVRIKVDESMATLLMRLVTLTKLHIHWLDIKYPTVFLSHFPNLAICDLNCDKSVDVNSLCTALSACANVTDLTVNHPHLTCDHLTSILSQLVLLVRLSLHYCQGLHSLRFLVTKLHLRVFELHEVHHMPLKEYAHMRAMASTLESLILRFSCAVRWSERRRDQWTPTSPRFSRTEWPVLKEFVLDEDSDVEEEAEEDERELEPDPASPIGSKKE